MKKQIVILIILLISKISLAQTDFSKITNYYNKEKNFNGTVLVATNGKIDYIEAVGISNRKNKIKMQTDTKFKIASVTKTFTAVLILQLYEEGKIDLKVPFGKYYPNYKGNAKDLVTIDNLLTYSSGIPDTAVKQGMNPYLNPIKIDEYIDKYCSNNVINKPGAESIYSNTEYIILTKIIENVTNKSYEEVLNEKILKPLNMKNSGLITSKKKIKGLTNSYTINDSTNEIILDKSYYFENYFGAAAMYSTAEDLLKFDIGIFTNKLLNKTNTDLMTKPNQNLNNTAYGVWYADGYGIFNIPFIYRTGGILGNCSNWIHTIDNNKSIIVLNNTNGTNLYEMSEQLYSVSKEQK